MKEQNKFTISGTIVGITSTTKKTIVNIATMSHDRQNDTTFLLIRFPRKVDVCGYNVKDNVIIEGFFSKGLLYGTEITYLPRPLDKYKKELEEDLSFKSTYITDRKNEILISGVVTNIQKVNNTPFTYVTVKYQEENIRVTFVGSVKNIEIGNEIAILAYLQSYESAKTKYSFVSLNAIDYQTFGMVEIEDNSNKENEENNEDEKTSISSIAIPNPFEL